MDGTRGALPVIPHKSRPSVVEGNDEQLVPKAPPGEPPPHRRKIAVKDARGGKHPFRPTPRVPQPTEIPDDSVDHVATVVQESPKSDDVERPPPTPPTRHPAELRALEALERQIQHEYSLSELERLQGQRKPRAVSAPRSREVESPSARPVPPPQPPPRGTARPFREFHAAPQPPPQPPYVPVKLPPRPPSPPRPPPEPDPLFDQIWEAVREVQEDALSRLSRNGWERQHKAAREEQQRYSAAAKLELAMEELHIALVAAANEHRDRVRKEYDDELQLCYERWLNREMLEGEEIERALNQELRLVPRSTAPSTDPTPFTHHEREQQMRNWALLFEAKEGAVVVAGDTGHILRSIVSDNGGDEARRWLGVWKEETHHHHALAHKIQLAWRCYTARRVLRRLRRARRVCLHQLLQAEHLREEEYTRRLEDLRRSQRYGAVEVQHAVQVLQRFSKVCIARTARERKRRVREKLSMGRTRQHAAQRIQAAFRGMVSRRAVYRMKHPGVQPWWENRSLSHAARHIQRVFRGWCTRRMQAKRKAMGCVIQRNVRLFLARRALQHAQHRTAEEARAAGRQYAARVVQRFARRHVVGRTPRTLSAERNEQPFAFVEWKDDNVVPIQRAWRCCRARRELQRRQEALAAYFIAAGTETPADRPRSPLLHAARFCRLLAWPPLGERVRVVGLHPPHDRLNGKVGVQWRNLKAVPPELTPDAAATKIQCAWRRRTARKEMHRRRSTVLLEYEATEHHAAAVIQAAFRIPPAKRELAKRREAAKSRDERELEEMACRQHHHAAMAIQGGWRQADARQLRNAGSLARKERTREDFIGDTAAHLQAAWRGWKARRQHLVIPHRRARVIQRFYRRRVRGRAERAELTSRRRQREAALRWIIQEEAAVAIQCLVRGWLARRALHQRKECTEQLTRVRVENDKNY
eukprot:Sspe_Gene.57434::Locus_31522_Transcript_1_1_Confidence_1.000_Length_2901::g.57434::m.57434